MDKKTIYDVAREAGVSISTVSRVINGSANVRESTRRKVEAACVNYRPVASARDLPAKRSKMIGVLINHRPEYFFLNDTYSNALLGISVAAKEAGYRLLLDICDTETEFDNLFYEQRVDGFVMMGVRKNSTLISLLKQHEVPFVLVGSYHEDESVYQVDINDQSAIFSVTNYLIGLGHKRIGIITSSPEYTSASDRVEGYCQAMREAGLTVKNEWIQFCENLTEAKAEQLAKHMLYLPNRVSAIIAFNDSVAMAIYKASKDCGLSIPRDLSVVGFDDTTLASYMSPPLTSVWQPSYEKGEKAIQMLISQIEGRETSGRRVELNCITMYRGSCAPCGEDLQ